MRLTLGTEMWYRTTRRFSILDGIETIRSVPKKYRIWYPALYLRVKSKVIQEYVPQDSIQNTPRNVQTEWSIHVWLRSSFHVLGRNSERLIKYESEVWKTLRHTALQHEVPSLSHLPCSSTLALLLISLFFFKSSLIFCLNHRTASCVSHWSLK